MDTLLPIRNIFRVQFQKKSASLAARVSDKVLLLKKSQAHKNLLFSKFANTFKEQSPTLGAGVGAAHNSK